MTVRPVTGLLLAVALCAAACGGSSPATQDAGDAGCQATTTNLSITARNTEFDTDCLAVRADTPFTIRLENHDPGVSHNLAIYTLDPSQTTSADQLFVGDLVSGAGVAVYDVPALGAGTDFFRCEVHPAQMFGTFMVEA